MSLNAGLALFWLPSLILLAGVVDDLRSRKIHNKLVLVALLIAAIYAFYQGGSAQLLAGLFGATTALFFHMPLVAIRALGAGDLKLMVAFGMATDWQTVLAVSILAIIWGGLLGVFKAILSGQGLALLQNTLRLMSTPKEAQKQSHKIPYSVALFFGWLSHLTLPANFLGGLL